MMVKTKSEAEITPKEYANLSYGDILAHYRTPYKRNNDITMLLEPRNQHISSTTTRIEPVSKDPLLPLPPPPPPRETVQQPPPPHSVTHYHMLPTPTPPSHYYTAQELAVWERGGEDELGMFGLSGDTQKIVRIIFVDLLTGPIFRREGLRAEREMMQWLGCMVQGARSHADVLEVLEGIKARTKAFWSWALMKIKEEYNFRRNRGVIDRGNRGRSYWRGHELLYRSMLKDLEAYISDIEGRVRIEVGCLVTCRKLAGKLMCLFRIV